MTDRQYPLGKFVFSAPLTRQQRDQAIRHPELGVVSLEKNVALYAWHGKHHVAHITSLRDRMGWGS